MLEGLCFSDRRDQCRGDHRTDTRDRQEQRRILVRLSKSGKLRIEYANATIKLFPLRPHVFDEQ